ncbi:hypothetical protein SteCoe_29586 [Stentor coeruleus]|uniref:Uncharacterized protein n=1 Tax=Stentor coeruleus TaxID=5963 RepID=A0A1R2B5I7_9CILI|nr:hypothetical protein SteCoe_29586 [Stentor coeruleus]
MFAYNDIQSLSSLQNLDTPALKADKLIDDEILIPLMSLNRSISISDIEKIYTNKIQNILEIVNPDLKPLSSSFWSRSLEDSVVTEEVLATLILKFLLGLESSVKLGEILKDFKSSRLKSLTDILKRIIASNELKSFNISGFLLFTDFKYRFTEYMKDLCQLNEDDFKHTLVTDLRGVILVEKQHFEWYKVDGFTSYNRKRYIKLFNTGYPEMDKAATFYILLDEFPHYFRRISCLTWEDSRNCSTPETTINDIQIVKQGIFLKYNFLNGDINILIKGLVFFY